MTRQVKITFVNVWNDKESHTYKNETTAIRWVNKAVRENPYELSKVVVSWYNQAYGCYVPYEMLDVATMKQKFIINIWTHGQFIESILKKVKA